MRFEGPVEDRLAIRELYGSYSESSMRQDRDHYLSLWCEDGLRIARDGTLNGKAEIAAHWDGIWAQIRQLGFFAEIGTIIVAGASATARVYCREIVLLNGGEVWKVIGQYDDILEKHEGRWLFKRREYRLIMDEGRNDQPLQAK